MDRLLIFVPLISGYAMTGICPMIRGKDAQVSKIQPRATVFKIVWPVLYLMIGYSWYRNRGLKMNLIFSSLLACLLSWQYFYNCRNKKVLALYSISFATLATLLIMVSTRDVMTKQMLTFLFVWLLLAFSMNKDTVRPLPS